MLWPNLLLKEIKIIIILLKLVEKEKFNLNNLLNNKLNTINDYCAVLYFIGNFKKKLCKNKFK